MKAVFALAATILSISSLSYAGSDHLSCSSPEGVIINGSLWTQDATVNQIESRKGAKISVTEVTTLSPNESAQLLLDESQASVRKAIADAKAKLEDPANQKDYQPDIIIVAPMSKPRYLVKHVEEECREIGNMEYNQRAELITVSLRWNDQLKRSFAQVSKKPLALKCIYSYATAPGGGAACAH